MSASVFKKVSLSSSLLSQRPFSYPKINQSLFIGGLVTVLRPPALNYLDGCNFDTLGLALPQNHEPQVKTPPRNGGRWWRLCSLPEYQPFSRAVMTTSTDLCFSFLSRLAPHGSKYAFDNVTQILFRHPCHGTLLPMYCHVGAMLYQIRAKNLT